MDAADLSARRPLVVKLGNSPAERPQSGLAAADLVVEHLTEGSLTRFSAVYYCAEAQEIGPIRSARLIDLELVPMFGALFAHVGGSEPVRQLIAASELAAADLDDYGRAPIFREIASRKRPFNRYSSTAELWTYAAERGLVPGPAVNPLSFAAAVPPGGRTATSVTVPYRASLSDATFAYDPASARFLRTADSSPALDPVSHAPLAAANLIVLYAPHETTTIVEDSLGSRSVKITLTGSGRAIVLRDGQAFDATWTRADPHRFFQFADAQNRTLALKPGPTWIEVVPPELNVRVE